MLAWSSVWSEVEMVGGLAMAAASFIERTKLLYVEPGRYWDG